MIANTQTLRTGLAAAAVLLLAATLCGCSSAIDHIPTSMGGLPEGVPARSATPPAYPAVHDMPPRRDDTALSAAENKRLRDDLNSTRGKVAAPTPPPEATGSPAARP